MKKMFFLFVICFMTIGCDRDTMSTIFPEIESYYKESCSWDGVAKDSLERFVVKVRGFLNEKPEARKDPLLPKIQEKVKTASQRFTIEVDTAWAGDTLIYF